MAEDSVLGREKVVEKEGRGGSEGEEWRNGEERREVGRGKERKRREGRRQVERMKIYKHLP